MSISKKEKTVLEDKLEKFKETGVVELNSSDMFTSTAEVNNDEREPDALSKSTTVSEEEAEHTDVLLESGSERVNPLDLKVDIVITPENKENFINSVIYNKPFEATYTIFGNITVSYRSRTQKDTSNIFRFIGKQFADKKIGTQAEYTEEVRKMLLACQLTEFNGVEFSPITDYSADSKELLDRLKSIEELNDGVVTALYTKLVEFESIYWAMVNNASNQNFWNPVESA